MFTEHIKISASPTNISSRLVHQSFGPSAQWCTCCSATLPPPSSVADVRRHALSQCGCTVYALRGMICDRAAVAQVHVNVFYAFFLCSNSSFTHLISSSSSSCLLISHCIFAHTTYTLFDIRVHNTLCVYARLRMFIYAVEYLNYIEYTLQLYRNHFFRSHSHQRNVIKSNK